MSVLFIKLLISLILSWLKKKLNVLIDKSLTRFANIFAAAGHPNCVFKINFNQLVKITNASEEDISE